MHKLYELKEMLCKELEEYGSKELTPGSLEVVDKLAHSIKNIEKIIEAYEDEEYSNRGGSYERGGNRGNMGGYSRENSYARGDGRGRGRNARRDSMGRYSRENRGGSYGYGGMSYADGMEEMVDSIRGMMGELPENIQKEAQRLVQKIEQEMM